MKQKDSKLTGLLALLVFAVFALCLLGVLLAGAGSYQGLVEENEEDYTVRTAGHYLATRVRQSGEVRIEDFQGVKALVFPQRIAGMEFVTRVYCYEGYLWELFCAASAELEPEDGEKLLKAETLDAELDGGLLKVDTGERTLLLSLRTGRQVAP